MTARTFVVSADPKVVRRVAADLTKQDIRTRVTRANLIDGHELATLSVSDSIDVQTPTPGLTQQRIGILNLLAEGLSTAEIADRYGISRHTTKCTLARIYRILGAHDRAHAVLIACRAGLIHGGAA
jgi:DNA-binding NarL/FixJ family response regulator